MKRNVGLYLFILCALAFLACGKDAKHPDALATYDDGTITQQDLDVYVHYMDKKRLKQQASVSEEAGRRQLLAEVAYLHIMADKVAEDTLKEDNQLLKPSAFAQSLVLYYKQKEGKRSHEVTEEQIAQRYETHADRFTLPDSITFQHIFLRKDKHSAQELRQRKHAVLQALRDGRDFADLAKRYSDSGSKAQDGKVGPIFRGKLEKSFEDQLFSHKDLRAPFQVRTVTGDHIVQILDYREKRTIPLDEVRNQIVSAIMAERDKEERIKFFAELYDRFNVRFHLENMQSDQEPIIQVGDDVISSEDIRAFIATLPKRQQVIMQQKDQLKGFLLTQLHDHLLFLYAEAQGLQEDKAFQDMWAWQKLNMRSTIAKKQALQQWGQELAKQQVLDYYKEHEGRFFHARTFDLAFVYFPFGELPPFAVHKNAEKVRALWLQKKRMDKELTALITECRGFYHDLGEMENSRTAFFGPVFQKSLRSLKPGEISDPIKTVNGLYVIFLRKSSDLRPLTPEDDFSAIKQRYLQLSQEDYLKQHKALILDSAHFEVLE